MKLVLVIWEDASQEAGPWVAMPASAPMAPRVFKQVGWLTSMTRKEIVLTQAIEDIQAGEVGLMAARERIPRGMVRSITELKEITA